MMKKRWISLLLTTGVLVAGLAGCGNSSSQKNAGAASSAAETEVVSDTEGTSGELETVRVAVMTNNVTQWVATVGEEEGIYEKNGITLEVTEFAAGINTADAVVLGQADIGNMADYALVNRIGSVDNSNLRILASTEVSNESNTGQSLYVNPNKIKEIGDLAGAPMATVPGTVVDYYVAKTYEYAKIAEADQNIIRLSDFAAGVTAAETGDIDAVWASGNNAQKLSDYGFEPLINQADLGIFTNAYLFSTDSYLASNESTLEKYLKAYQETIDWILANKDAAAKIIEEQNNTPQDVFLASLESEDYRLALKQTDVDTITKLEDWEYQNGNFDKEYDIKEFINTDPLKAIYPDAVDFK